MDRTLSKIQSVYPLTQEAIDDFLIYQRKLSLKKSKILFSPDRKHHHLYFIEKGAVRAYSHKGGREITFWIGLEEEVVFPYRSYVYGESSYETVELLEDCELFSIKIKDLQDIFLKSPEWAIWGRKFVEKELVKMEERFISHQFKTATERYQALMDERPEILNRIKLQYVASYLGMTQVSLSRIRAGR